MMDSETIMDQWLELWIHRSKINDRVVVVVRSAEFFSKAPVGIPAED
ncbi:hypothetical protein G210_4908 [Candida maltosa Xu316]|uniref:Uncharacterized protein n=1 Tax=Candida maltosa (strain Xu316) TaxID=1245528 RepID=M3K4A9_CANMX|nr:hypothetical protein G210_4908 [Candida maltosa Xu316]